MAKELQITYLFNSGFSVETGDRVLVFDYFKDPAKTLPDILSRGKKIDIFASHAHFDHFNPRIGALAGERARYFLSFDLKGAAAAGNLADSAIVYLNAYDAFADEAIKIQTFSSTDEGVSFLVEIEGWKIFHAGDFNWWHWKEDTKENILLAKNAFMKQMKKLDGLKADIAFFPVDRRLEEFCDLGAREFCRRTEIGYLATMHNTLHQPWKAPRDFLPPERLISIWTPEKPGEEIKIIR